MNRNKLFPPLVCGFGAAVLSTVPGVRNYACCLIVPLAAVLSINLDHKINKSILPIKSSNAIFFGIATGIFAAFFASFFDVLITFITHSNDFIESLPQTEELIKNYKLNDLLDQTMVILRQMANEIRTSGFSIFYSFGILFSNLIINLIFGLLGGLLGMALINKRPRV
jgi:hypothetical protein